MACWEKADYYSFAIVPKLAIWIEGLYNAIMSWMHKRLRLEKAPWTARCVPRLLWGRRSSKVFPPGTWIHNVQACSWPVSTQLREGSWWHRTTGLGIWRNHCKCGCRCWKPEKFVFELGELLLAWETEAVLHVVVQEIDGFWFEQSAQFRIRVDYVLKKDLVNIRVESAVSEPGPKNIQGNKLRLWSRELYPRIVRRRVKLKVLRIFGRDLGISHCDGR